MAINVQTIEEIPAEDDRDMRWFLVDVDDGTVPGKVKALIPESGWARLTGAVDDPADWIRDALRRQVADVPAVDQVSALRKRSPVELRVPEID